MQLFKSGVVDKYVSHIEAETDSESQFTKSLISGISSEESSLLLDRDELIINIKNNRTGLVK